MSEQHPAEKLAAILCSWKRRANCATQAAAMLLTIPELERQRDEQERIAEGMRRLNVTLVMENKELLAEVLKLRNETKTAA